MIVTGSGITGTLADAARESLDKEVDRLRKGGLLKAGKKTSERLVWTKETHSAAKEFEKNLDLSLLKDLGVIMQQSDAKSIKWTGPIVYSDVLSDPLKYDTSGTGNGVFGILALGTLKLPEIGGTSKVIASGAVAYFRESDNVVYRSCEGGRGILFYVSAE